jgi:phosphonate transport system substrate-binding protein
VRVLLLAAVGVALTLAGCGSSSAGSAGAPPGGPVLTLGAIPDQDPEQLARLHPVVARDLSRRSASA